MPYRHRFLLRHRLFAEPRLGRDALAAGLVINVTAENVIRMLPPLVMTEAEGREVVARLVPLVKAFLDKRVAA